jgi:hypothetical protein
MVNQKKRRSGARLSTSALSSYLDKTERRRAYSAFFAILLALPRRSGQYALLAAAVGDE